MISVGHPHYPIERILYQWLKTEDANCALIIKDSMKSLRCQNTIPPTGFLYQIHSLFFFSRWVQVFGHEIRPAYKY